MKPRRPRAMDFGRPSDPRFKRLQRASIEEGEDDVGFAWATLAFSNSKGDEYAILFRRDVRRLRDWLTRWLKWREEAGC